MTTLRKKIKLNYLNSFFQQINENKGHSFNLSVGIPIFSRFQNKTSVAKSKIQVETLEKMMNDEMKDYGSKKKIKLNKFKLKDFIKGI